MASFSLDRTLSALSSGVIYKYNKGAGEAFIITNYHVVFDDNTRPALLVTETQNRGELENISALRRKALPGQNREEL